MRSSAEAVCSRMLTRIATAFCQRHRGDNTGQSYTDVGIIERVYWLRRDFKSPQPKRVP
jgi:hypothetical protein